MPHWFNGQAYDTDQLTLTAQDPALLYGATAFSTLRVYHQDLTHPLTAWEAHCDRLGRTLAAFGWGAPQWSRLRQGAQWLAATYPVLRLTCLPDGRELITGRPLPADLDTRQRLGITAWVTPPGDYARSLPQHKTGNYLSCWLAGQTARRHQAQTAILTNPQGHWLETATGNLWGWAAGRWYSPDPAAGTLPGIARQHLLQHLRSQGIPVDTRPWTPQRIAKFTALAHCNAVVQLVPIPTVLTSGSRLEYSLDCAPLRQLQHHGWALQSPGHL